MTKSSAKDTALLIDANSLIHRAWHALPPLTTPDGKLINAAYGFASVLLKIVREMHPTYLVACWDTPEPTFRHEAKPEYKAQREEQPQDFYDQFPIVKKIVEAFGGANVELPGYEADDLLATVAVRLAKKNIAVSLLTSDRDVWQMVSPEIHAIVPALKGAEDATVIDPKTLKERTGLTAEQIPDYKALRGDPSDNLKGVPGIGEKTATDLLQKFKTMEGVFKAAHNAKSDLSPSVRAKLVAGEKEARETLPLVQLVLNVPITATDESFKRKTVDDEALKTLFLSLGFKTLLARALGSKEAADVVEHGARNMERKKDEIVVASSLEAILVEAKEEKRLVIRPITETQTTLFQSAPFIALASRAHVLLVTTEMAKEKQHRKRLSDIFSDATVAKVGHGLKDAWHWAHNQGFSLEGLSFDVEIASYLLASGESGHDLESLASIRLGQSFADTAEKPLLEVAAIRELAEQLEKELQAEHLDAFMARFETPLLSILGKMEEAGIKIEVPYFKTLSDDFRSTKQRLEKEMESLAGEPFNPASPQQLGRVLFDVLKISTKGIKRGKTGISTAAAELEKLEGAHPIIEKIGEYREVAKLLSTYVDALPLLADNDGRVHTTFNQTVAATGRLSSTNPNLQNIPIRTPLGRKIRRGFVAQKGFQLLSCDYSQIELRVVAALAKDDAMLDAFRRGIDIHTATAAAIWNIAIEDVTKDQRRSAKAINFGIIYGQGPFGLAKTADISHDDAKRFINEYFYVYSGVRNFLDETKALARSRGYVETLFGRRRSTIEINSSRPEIRAAAERMAINMPVQGTAADFIKLAMVAVDKKLSSISARATMLLQVHDELVFEVPVDEVAIVAHAVKDLMEHVEKIGVPIVVDTKAGLNWEEMSPVV